MSVDIAAIAPEILADAEALIAAVTSGSKLDSELVRRIQARSERIRERVFREHGLLDIAVPAIREFRDR